MEEKEENAMTRRKMEGIKWNEMKLNEGKKEGMVVKYKGNKVKKNK